MLGGSRLLTIFFLVLVGTVAIVSAEDSRAGDATVP